MTKNLEIKISYEGRTGVLNLTGPSVKVYSLVEAMQCLEDRRLGACDIAAAFAAHDAIVDHANRDAISREEALRLVNVMTRHLPLVTTHYSQDSVEYVFLGLKDTDDKSVKSFVWCSIFLHLDHETPCETCIADEEGLSSLIYMVDGAANID